jgi:hypothetical protein
MVQEATAKLEQILDSAVKIEGKALDFAISGEITGDTTEQDFAHGLLDADYNARIPVLVFTVMTDSNSGAAGGIVAGVHDATNTKHTVATGIKYHVIAI